MQKEFNITGICYPDQHYRMDNREKLKNIKLWYGQKYHQEGLNQLADYLTIHDVDKGFLLVFDDRKKKSWKVEDVTHAGKDIFGVWV